MLRRTVLTALIAAVVVAAPGAASDQTRVKSYCSTTGDVCFGIFKAGGTYSFRLTLAAKYFQRYRVCVRPLGEQGTCKSFPVKKTGVGWGGTVVWQRNYQVRGPRGYRVTWRQGTRRLGPSLTFYLPAPV
jgi:hypothetical protein